MKHAILVASRAHTLDFHVPVPEMPREVNDLRPKAIVCAGVDDSLAETLCGRAEELLRSGFGREALGLLTSIANTSDWNPCWFSVETWLSSNSTKRDVSALWPCVLRLSARACTSGSIVILFVIAGQVSASSP